MYVTSPQADKASATGFSFLACDLSNLSDFQAFARGDCDAYARNDTREKSSKPLAEPCLYVSLRGGLGRRRNLLPDGLAPETGKNKKTREGADSTL